MSEQRQFVNSEPFVRFEQTVNQERSFLKSFPFPSSVDVLTALRKDRSGVPTQEVASSLNIDEARVKKLISPYLEKKVVTITWKDGKEFLVFS